MIIMSDSEPELELELESLRSEITAVAGDCGGRGLIKVSMDGWFSAVGEKCTCSFAISGGGLCLTRPVSA